MNKLEAHYAGQIIRLFLIAVITSSGCRSAASLRASANPASLLQTEPSHEILMPSDSTDQVYKGLNNTQSVFRFYSLMNNQPVWNIGNELTIHSDSMILLIQGVRYYGLLPKNYHIDEIRLNVQNLDNADGLLRIDALLSDAFISIASDVKYGRLKRGDASRDDSLRMLLLQRALNGFGLRRALELQEPGFSEYHSLKEALRSLLDSLNGDGRKEVLQGITDESTAIDDKIQTIEINLERWRWENSAFGDRFLFINIPSFMLQVVSDDSVILDSRIIVGTPDKQTPILSSTIQCLVTYPYWHVPRKISVEEYLPLLQNDPSFISRNNFEVLDRKGRVLNPDSVDWKKFSKNRFPVSLRQREGPENSLGVIKFVFDNPYAVFLHDTNSKRLFKSNVRAFSHGCIRMERAVDLAHYLVTGFIGETSKIIEKYLKEEERHTIDLQNPIPIYVRYFTCESREDGVYYYEDLYGLDKELLEGLYK